MPFGPVPKKADPHACVVCLQGGPRVRSIHVMPEYRTEWIGAIVDVPRFQANKVTVPRADPVHILKAGQTVKGSGHYCMSLPSILDDTQDWKLVVDLKGHGKYPNMIQRSWQRPDIVVHAMSICQLFWLSWWSHTNWKWRGSIWTRWQSMKVWPLIWRMMDDGQILSLWGGHNTSCLQVHVWCTEIARVERVNEKQVISNCLSLSLYYFILCVKSLKAFAWPKSFPKDSWAISLLKSYPLTKYNSSQSSLEGNCCNYSCM